MDILPIKFRSPPPKPPRRRHSDQLSVSSTGTFPSSKRKIVVESHCCNDNKHCTENSTSSCGSLPANWTPEFCLENKIENLPVFSEKECISKSTKSTSHNKFEFKELILERSKSNFMGNIIPQLTNNSKQLIIKKYEAPYVYLVSKEKLFSFDDLKKHFQKFLHKDSHRRHNSDPLPLNFDCHNFYAFSPALSDNDSKLDLCGTKENQCLRQEIKSLKEINSKLWENLCCVQASIEKLKNCSADSSNVLPISDLLMSIYDSLKAKDSAMEDRMKIIIQERDNAINDLDKMVHAVANFDDKYSCPEDKLSDEKIKELLKEVEVTCNPGKLLQQQRLLLSYLYRSKELKLDRMLHEMKLIAADRDSLKLRVQLLETELKHLKLSNEVWDSDNKLWESSLLNTLCQVIQQRDVASKSYNAHNMDYFHGRSTVHEKSLDSEEIGDCLQKLEGACVKKKIFSFSPNEIKKYSPLTAKSRSNEVRYLKEEIFILNSSLEAEIEKRKCTEEKCVRLERLVNVLQKKLNGQNVGIPV